MIAERAEGGKDRSCVDERGPSRPEPLGPRADDARPVDCEVPLLPAGEDLRTDEPEQSGKEGERSDHGEQHPDRRGDGHPVEERHSEREHPEKRDTDDDPREQHCTTGGVDRGRDRRLEVLARDETLPVAGDDEQGVVHAHAEPDQQHQLRRELRHLQEVGEHPDDRHGGAEGGEGRHQGERHGEDRAEDQQQDDPGKEDPEAGAGERLTIGRFRDLARHGDLDVRSVRALGGRDELARDRVGDVPREPVEGHRRERGRAVGADLVGASRSVRTGHRSHVGDLLDLLQHRRDRGHHGGVGNLRAARRLEHDLLAVAGKLRSRGLQQRERTGRFCIREGEVVGVGGADRAADQRGADERGQPEHHHDHAVAHAPAGKGLHWGSCGEIGARGRQGG